MLVVEIYKYVYWKICNFYNKCFEDDKSNENYYNLENMGDYPYISK